MLTSTIIRLMAVSVLIGRERSYYSFSIQFCQFRIISNKVRVIWSECLKIFASGMFSQQLLEPVASLAAAPKVSREKGAKHYTSNTLSIYGTLRRC